MTIVLSTDNKYVMHCCVTIASILENNDDIDLYIISDDLSVENQEILNDLVSRYKCSIKYLFVDSKLLNNLPMPEGNDMSHISIATYFRLFIPQLIPQNISKVLYLDCDIVVRHSLRELWHTDIHEYALAAVYQNDSWALDCKAHSRLDIPVSFGYFNAGVLLINLEFWRENNSFEKIIHFISNKYDLIISHDQDVLNAIFYDKTLRISCKWNMLSTYFTCDIHRYKEERFLDYKESILNYHKNNPFIIHYVSKMKPWMYACRHPWKEEYYYYLSKTKWAGWQPRFILRDFLKHNIYERFRYYRGQKFLNIEKNENC